MKKAISQEVIYDIYTIDLDIFILVLIEACSVSVAYDRPCEVSRWDVQNESGDTSSKDLKSHRWHENRDSK